MIYFAAVVNGIRYCLNELSHTAYVMSFNNRPEDVTSPDIYLGPRNDESCKFYSGNIEIPSSIYVNGNYYEVKYVGHGAFYNSEKLLSVSIPSSVTRIGKYAFYNCKMLSNVSIPIKSKLTKVDDCAFARCSSLKTIFFPKSLEAFGHTIFSNCPSLSAINIPTENVKAAGSINLRTCPNLDTIYVSMGQKNSSLYKTIPDKIVELSEIDMDRLLDGDSFGHNIGNNNIIFYYTICNDDPGYAKSQLVKLYWIIADWRGNIIKQKEKLVKPNNFTIEKRLQSYLNITQWDAETYGTDEFDVLYEFINDLKSANLMVTYDCICENDALNRMMQKYSLKEGIELLANVELYSLDKRHEKLFDVGYYIQSIRISQFYNQLLYDKDRRFDFKKKNEIDKIYYCYKELKERNL